jgi:fimbrial chaperone protein
LAPGTPACHLAIVVLVVLWATVSAGSETLIRPVPIKLWPDSATQLVSVRNNGDDPVRFQASVYSWAVSPDGDPAMTPTDDILFFPPLLSINPDVDQIVRVGASGFGAVERAYILILQQLPPPPVAPAAQKRLAPKIDILQKLAVPLYVEPPNLQYAIAIDDITLRNGRLSFRVVNNGNVHVVAGVQVTGRGASDKQVFKTAIKPVLSGQLLAGTYRNSSTDIPKAVCAEIRNLKISVAFDEQVNKYTLKPNGITKDFTPPAGSCGR